MKTNRILILLLPLLALYFTSCVPQRKYEELEAKYKSCDQELTKLRDSSRQAIDAYKELSSQHERLKKATDALGRDTSILGASYRQMKEQYDKINKLNDEIMRKIEFLQKGSEAEASKLSVQLEATRLELQRKEDALKLFERELNVKKSELEAKEKRIKELEDILAKQEAASKALRDKVANALKAFEGKGLTVVQKNGRVYVSMEAKLLFASGSYKVDQEGKDAIVKLSKVLEDAKDIEILVEGHTDTDKLNSPNVPRDNWELSVLRATSVVKMMLESSRMDPKRISAAGRSEFLPVDAADKAKNRRIEIVLIPNLDELYKALDN
ncbi:MAG: OmpA family protein [Flavobacteriales bacterium]